MNKFLTEYPIWYATFCVVAGLVYAYILYSKKSPWGASLNRLLAVSRFFVVTIITFLLLGPLLEKTVNIFEKPIVVLAVDNSTSMEFSIPKNEKKALISSLSLLGENLSEQGYDVQVRSLGTKAQQIDSLTFNEPSTDLSNMLGKAKNEFDDQNLAGVVLVSDGIYNQGISPEYLGFPFPLHTIGVGDTVPKKDLSIKSAKANRIAYKGNKFPIRVTVADFGFDGQTTDILLRQGGEVLERKTINCGAGVQDITFLAEATEEGVQHFIIELSPLKGEFTTKNNTKHIYIDVLDAKEKILIVAEAPHPDVKALRNALAKNENFEINTYIPLLFDANSVSPINLKDKYGLIILYQVPSIANRLAKQLDELLKTDASILYVLGEKSNIPKFNAINQIVSINANGNQKDKVMPEVNALFSQFSLEDEVKGMIGRYPPLMVPFGDYLPQRETQSILLQKVGSIITQKPILLTGAIGDKKVAVLTSEGIWQWRMQNFAQEQNHDAFDNLLSKLVQYLSSKEDKRKFRVHTSQNQYDESDDVSFESELYNDIYEPVYGVEVKLTLVEKFTKDSLTYQYDHASSQQKFTVRGLASGVYKYYASTSSGGKTYYAQGEFSVEKLDLEAINTTADFRLMRQLAQNSGGEFFIGTKGLDALKNKLVENKTPDRIHSQTQFKLLLDLPWLALLLIILISVEWIARKMNGAY